MIFRSLAHAVTVTPNGRDVILQLLDKMEVWQFHMQELSQYCVEIWIMYR